MINQIMSYSIDEACKMFCPKTPEQDYDFFEKWKSGFVQRIHYQNMPSSFYPSLSTRDVPQDYIQGRSPGYAEGFMACHTLLV